MRRQTQRLFSTGLRFVWLLPAVSRAAAGGGCVVVSGGDDWDEPLSSSQRFCGDSWDAETQQMARLREKYASHVVGRSVVPDAAGDADENLAEDLTEARLQHAQARMDAEFLARPAAAAATGADHGSASKIRVCEACRGERSIKHEYNHRVMERMCETCDGEGVLTTGENGAACAPRCARRKAPRSPPRPRLLTALATVHHDGATRRLRTSTLSACAPSPVIRKTHAGA